MGQGAAQAVEDAVVLAQLVSADLPLETLLQRFMQRRYDRCKFIWEISVQVGKWELTQDPTADHPALRRKMLEVMALPI
jgi:2-polyprenyl-6-methoxyphenol hydroxylase-like FAD-dependent oxidoreductase